MDEKELRASVIAVVRSIAPEIEFGRIDAEKPLRTQIDLDSMDWLNVIAGLHDTLRIDIPESDYGKLSTLNSIVDYLAGRLAQHPVG